MKEKSLAEMSLDELVAKEKQVKTGLLVLTVVLVLLFATAIFLTIKQGFSVFTILPVVFLGSLIAMIGLLKKIQKEILSRNK